MKISRELNCKLNFLLNDCLPPVLRDRKWLLWPLYKMLFKDKSGLYMNFHRDVFHMSTERFNQVNRESHAVVIERETNLNQACIKRILGQAEGPAVLEVGCGKGFLSGKLAEHFKVTATDLALAPALRGHYPAVAFLECDSDRLPFHDKSFDTVVCTHMLEHVRNIQATLSELRRVCRKRLIIVVPCERPYWYTFNLHIHFFPYEYSLLAVTGTRPGQSLEKLDGDWFYQERRH